MLAAIPVGPPEIVTVKFVLNSETVVVRTATEESLFVTLLGVGSTDTVDPRKPDHMLWEKDLEWTKSFLPSGTRVRMERYGKTAAGYELAILYRLSDNLSWNRWIVQSGGSYASTNRFVDFGQEAEDARRAKKGIWALLPEPKPVESPKPVEQPKPAIARKPRPKPAREAVAGFGNKPVASSAPRYRRYRRMDRSQFNLMMGGMMGGMMSSAYGYGGGYGYGYGGGVNPNQHMVSGYYRSNGTYVAPYMRTNPNGTIRDNLSFPGNR